MTSKKRAGIDSLKKSLKSLPQSDDDDFVPDKKKPKRGPRAECFEAAKQLSLEIREQKGSRQKKGHRTEACAVTNHQ